ncbi:hypothetical protein M9Y10_001424 [Tritrichomonas musculus]|uniref:Uncharacterized protein n=1 Tax=Tritrichomonas musculus TaxID=1915356 RepID=A0ABR2L718_9EUKA
MDDDLPLLFFSSENVETAMRIGRIDLLLALLPCYLLLSSVLSEGLNREQRLEKLNLGFSIALTYYKEYVNYDFTKGLQSRNRNGGNNRHMTLFDPIWLKKYLTLTYSLSKVLIDLDAVHLGSLGTHFLEHFFGMIRRFCSGNDSASSFDKAIDNILIIKLLQKEESGENNHSLRRSDSGARINKETKIPKEVPICVNLWRASELFQVVGPLLNNDFHNEVHEEAQHFIDDTKENVIQYISSLITKTNKKYYSTANLRINSTAGLTSLKRIISGNMI